MAEKAKICDVSRMPDYCSLGCKVADTSQAGFGCREIAIAEHEMRTHGGQGKYAASKLLKGRITGSCT